jgi:hypothetical protein
MEGKAGLRIAYSNQKTRKKRKINNDALKKIRFCFES